ncbi:MAG: sugar ABC transporter substrate-binding protein [Christensenellales bacterium]|jgi:ribose transport system substrate-binding protein
MKRRSICAVIIIILLAFASGCALQDLQPSPEIPPSATPSLPQPTQPPPQTPAPSAVMPSIDTGNLEDHEVFEQLDDADSYKIGYSVPVSDAIETLKAIQGMQRLVRDGDTLEIFDAGSDAEKQTEDVKEMIEQGYDLVFITPVDAFGCAPPLLALAEAEIPSVLVLETSSDIDLAKGEVTADYERIGYETGKALIESCLQQYGRADIYLQRNTSSLTLKERVDGFMQALDEYEHSVRLVAAEEEKDDRQAGMDLSGIEGINGIFFVNPQGMQGAVDFVGNKEVLIMGLDDEDYALEAVHRRQINAAMIRLPGAMGEYAMVTGYRLLSGESGSDLFMRLGGEYVDADNVWMFKREADMWMNQYGDLISRG